MTEPPQPPAHNDTGLDLARKIAQSVGAQSRRRRRRDNRREPIVPQSSGTHPDDRDPKLLSEAVDQLIEAKGWATDLNVHTLLARWSSLVGGVNAAHSHPESYADTVLTVRTESTVWATSMRVSMTSWGRAPSVASKCSVPKVRRGKRDGAQSATAGGPGTRTADQQSGVRTGSTGSTRGASKGLQSAV